MALLLFLLGIVGFLTGVSAGLFTLLVLGIRQGDRAKRLTGTPGSPAEVLARRVLTGSRGCEADGKTGAGQ
jgi:hypothetical protein